MNINKFVTKYQLSDKSEIEKIELFCYFHGLGTANFSFSIAVASKWLTDAGFSSPNTTRLKRNIQKTKSIVKSNIKDHFKLRIDRLQEIDKELSLFI
ncbi:hypothetical protein EFP84_18730 [Leptospira kmetyi]|uniref:Uncharacterized protein n=1 Tax=Leptospira kmetyi TaxID=408139 RepID=A0AAD0US63_9LEPT|nr:hypothetical protein [Leptospira kmetyi]AYV57681.1 hypothetical protein EFP84_18730 [Leptospira kmetyi]